ncbi:hypothetical protein SGLAM104S_10246 [Streptomyces glaucescens]
MAQWPGQQRCHQPGGPATQGEGPLGQTSREPLLLPGRRHTPTSARSGTKRKNTNEARRTLAGRHTADWTTTRMGLQLTADDREGTTLTPNHRRLPERSG